MSIDQRFWAKVDKRAPDECWPWVAARQPNGYGKIGVAGKSALAHRVAWELQNGLIPDGMHVCHHCDNPPCQNGAHLFLGTNSDNRTDSWIKGRIPVGDRCWQRKYPERIPRGSARGQAKLNETSVKQIKERWHAGLSLSVFGREYGVSAGAIQGIVKGKRWKHVPWPYPEVAV